MKWGATADTITDQQLLKEFKKILVTILNRT